MVHQQRDIQKTLSIQTVYILRRHTRTNINLSFVISDHPLILNVLYSYRTAHPHTHNPPPPHLTQTQTQPHQPSLSLSPSLSLILSLPPSPSHTHSLTHSLTSDFWMRKCLQDPCQWTERTYSCLPWLWRTRKSPSLCSSCCTSSLGTAPWYQACWHRGRSTSGTATTAGGT